MFNIGGAELIVLLLIAFIVVGPKDLPKIARALARAVKAIRAMVEEVKRETGLDEIEQDLKKVESEVNTAKSNISKELRDIDPRPDLQKTTLEVNKEIKDIRKELSFKSFKEQGGKK